MRTQNNLNAVCLLIEHPSVFQLFIQPILFIEYWAFFQALEIKLVIKIGINFCFYDALKGQRQTLNIFKLINSIVCYVMSAMGEKQHAKRDKECHRVGVRVGLTENVKCEQRFEGKGMNHKDIWRRTCAGQGDSQCRDTGEKIAWHIPGSSRRLWLELGTWRRES